MLPVEMIVGHTIRLWQLVCQLEWRVIRPHGLVLSSIVFASQAFRLGVHLVD